MARSALLNVMVQAAMKAGRSLSRDFGEVQNLQVSMKGPGDYVSQADRKAEEIVFTELSKARPGYAFLMEERGAVEGEDAQHRWIVDPLDLAYVAAGRMAGFWEIGLSSWDIAAGILLVREAGGFVSDMDGGQGMLDNGEVVAGNEVIQRALLKTIKKPLPPR